MSPLVVEQLQRHGVSQADVQPILDAFGAGDAGRHRRNDGGTGRGASAAAAEEIVEKIKKDIEPSGVNHFVACITDSFPKPPVGDIDVPDAQDQLRLIHDKVMPAFA